MLDRCDFKNQWMEKECGRKTLNDGGEPYCIIHGTRRFVIRAYDIRPDFESDEAPLKSGASWSEDDIDILKQMLADGSKVEEISSVLERSKNSVYNKIWALTRKDKDD